jgi:hypothetical protein
MDSLELALRQLSDVRALLTESAEITKLAGHLRQSQQTLSLGENGTLPVLPDQPGVYYFEAKFSFTTPGDLASFGKQWGLIRGEAHEGKIPRYYPARAKHHLADLAAGRPIPFYLGKRKSIADRIENHINSPLESGTYALKLRARPPLINGVAFTYSFKAFDVPATAYYGVELIEADLRKILNPIVGKQ